SSEYSENPAGEAEVPPVRDDPQESLSGEEVSGAEGAPENGKCTPLFLDFKIYFSTVTEDCVRASLERVPQEGRKDIFEVQT
ncbi:MAG: hypothetical protein PHH70_04890, partial [Candidatus Gracilibacteria bacterium]|nr:hypothetical protein [Candidatus Gracilibacteria bacterium]